MIESELRSLVLGDSNITALIGERMYPIWLPQNPTLPALSYFRVSGPRQHNLDGEAHVTPRIQVDSWAETYAEVKNLADLVRKRINAYLNSNAGADQIQDALIDNDRDFYESEPEVFRVSQDYMLHYNES